MRYRLLHNLDSNAMWKGYAEGDLLDEVWTGDVSVDAQRMTSPDGGLRMEVLAEMVFVEHNSDYRPKAMTIRSMSVGDVVVLGEVAYACQPNGWWRVHLEPGQVVTLSDY